MMIRTQVSSSSPTFAGNDKWWSLKLIIFCWWLLFWWWWMRAVLCHMMMVCKIAAKRQQRSEKKEKVERNKMKRWRNAQPFDGFTRGSGCRQKQWKRMEKPLLRLLPGFGFFASFSPLHHHLFFCSCLCGIVFWSCFIMLTSLCFSIFFSSSQFSGLRIELLQVRCCQDGEESK